MDNSYLKLCKLEMYRDREAWARWVSFSDSLSLGTDKCQSRLQLILVSFLIKVNRDIGFSLSVSNSVSISESLLLLFLNRTRNQNYFYDYFDTLLIKTLKRSLKSKLCDLSILLGQTHYDFFTDCNFH
jgi:hypothetical protein